MSGPNWRFTLHEIIFEAETPAGKAFDIALLVAIVISVLAVMLESVAAIGDRYGTLLLSVEWIMTILFTIEYVLRLLCAPRRMRYAVSFFGVIDLMAILPTYLMLLPIEGAVVSLTTIRVLRLLRVFRVLKLGHLLGEASELRSALAASRHKIFVFLWTVVLLVVVLGSAMYVIEGPASGFSSIPRSIYWAIVTLTTVGYGDITPQSPLGQMLASCIMIVGYGIIAIPTGIVTSEMAARRAHRPTSSRPCPACQTTDHDEDASHCKHCGMKLTKP